MSSLAYVLIINLVIAGTLQQDPCQVSNHRIARDPQGERGGLTLPSRDLCDSRIREGWYRFESPAGGDMPTSCVEMNHCGTYHPVWLDGDIPPADGAIHNMTARMTFVNCASGLKAYPIRIKNCGTYRVYYLTSLDTCPAAYCFGSSGPCPPGTNSETGMSPGCTSNFTSFDQIPVVEVRPGQRPNSATQEIQFECGLLIISSMHAGDVVDVLWYVKDSSNKLGPFRLPITQLPHVLHERDWEHLNLPLGMNFWCEMRRKLPFHVAPSFYKRSAKYYAGIKINTNKTIVARGETKTIQLQPTVPILCGDRDSCRLTLDIDFPARYQHAGCTTQGTAAGTSVCGVEIDGLGRNGDWDTYRNTKYDLQVYGKVSYIISNQRSYSFDLKMRNTVTFRLHPVWNDFLLTTKVVVIEPDIKFSASASCWSDGDPRIQTFDGCYYSYQREGEFIMYLHDSLPEQVNVFVQKCSPIVNGTCICGVAVKSGSEVFIMDQCRVRGQSSSSRPIRLGLLECSDKSMDIIESDPTKYKITLPSGTVVKMRQYWGVRVDILPSVRDVQQVKGLCGNFDGNKNNDFIHRKSGSVNPSSCKGKKDKFVKSWRVVTASKESLYNGLSAGSINKPLSLYCRCNFTCDSFSCNVVPQVHCGFDEFLDQCTRTGTDRNDLFRNDCYTRRRKRTTPSRFASDLSDLDSPPFLYDPNHLAPEPSWRGGWTEARARQHCESRILQTPAGRKCGELGLDFSSAVDSCMDDIYLTASTDFVEAGVNGMFAKCSAELYRNGTVRNAVSPPAEFTNLLCQSDCSGHGTCHQGECVCDNGYSAADCSIDLNAPPTIMGTARDGVCDVSTRQCLAIPIYGNYFLDSPNLLCRITVTEIYADGRTEVASSRDYPGQYQHLQEVICPLPLQRIHKRSAGSPVLGRIYRISVSNNGQLFSSQTVVTAYPKDCVSCDTAKAECSIKPNAACFIDGQCYNSGDVNHSFLCKICSPDQSRFTWTVKSGTCLIGGKCRKKYEKNPKNKSLHCDPAKDKNRWTHLGGACVSRYTSTSSSACSRIPINLGGCGGGQIKYPSSGRYGNFLICMWRIHAPKNKIIRLEYLVFNTEYDYDFVKVYDGDKTSDRLLQSSSGPGTLPATVTGTKNSLLVEFTSDLDTQSTGFTLKYTFVNRGL